MFYLSLRHLLFLKSLGVSDSQLDTFEQRRAECRRIAVAVQVQQLPGQLGGLAAAGQRLKRHPGRFAQGAVELKQKFKLDFQDLMSVARRGPPTRD